MKRTMLAIAVVTMLAGTSLGETVPMRATEGERPVLDGTLDDGEWGGARAVSLDPVGEAYLLRDDEALYVGLRVGSNCIPSLALLQGEKVLVLHASASLGTAEYARSGDAWRAKRSFAWQCRDGQATDEDRERFLATEGWLATTTGTGRRGEAEYRIDRRLLQGASVRIAVVACRLQPMPLTACAWPDTVGDGTRSQELLFGKTPDLEFKPETWAELKLGPAPTPAERLDAALDRIEAEPDPVDAYLALLGLLDSHGAAAASSERVSRLRRRLEKQKAVAPEAKAQRRLESALKVVRKKLLEITERYPGTRAARIAQERLESLGP